jgi:hypothetical protein
MTPTEARALADQCELAWPDPPHDDMVIPDALRSLADQVEALQGQAMSSVEREEYFAMKKDAERYRWLRTTYVKVRKVIMPGLWGECIFYYNRGPALDEAIDSAREAQ